MRGSLPSFPENEILVFAEKNHKWRDQALTPLWFTGNGFASKQKELWKLWICPKGHPHKKASNK